MTELFIKKNWDEDGTIFYLHFQNNIAIAQVEISDNSRVILTKERPIIGNAMLYDQSIDELELDEKDYITKNEFLDVFYDKK